MIARTPTNLRLGPRLDERAGTARGTLPRQYDDAGCGVRVMSTEGRVKELLYALAHRNDEPVRLMRERLLSIQTRLKAGEALAAADQAWLDSEWERAASKQGIVPLRRGQFYNETL